MRILTVPDLSGMAPEAIRESRPVFQHLVGRHKRVAGFGRYGHAELAFIIRRGRHRGHHAVWIEPYLLKVREPQAGAAKGRPRRTRR